MSKICTSCKETLPLESFCKRSVSKDGLALICRGCAADFKKEYYSDPEARKKVLEQKSLWRKSHLKEKNLMNKKWREENREKYTASWKKSRIKHKYDKKNPLSQKVLVYRARWRKDNPDKQKMIQARSNAKARGTLKGRLNGNTATMVGSSLKRKGGSKNLQKWERLVGYTVAELKDRLEKQFTPEMSWENYGSYWQIDHKIPVAVFNFQTPEDIDFKKCWELKNLQPLGKAENRRKNCRLTQAFQPSLLLRGANG